ncbi:MAG: NADH-quinone oxidoreductase subunit L [Candidatus Nitrotoga sp.]
MDYNLIVTLIVALPLLATVINGLNLLAGDKFHYKTVQNITFNAILLSFIGSVWVFMQVLDDPTPKQVHLYSWLASGDVKINIGFMIDTLSAIMMLVVTGFSVLVARFSINYMHGDYSFTRYFTALALFVYAMLILVMGNNFVMLFIGWETVGVCSYLLIGHYYQRISASRAGTKAFLMNRVGDAGFLMGLFIMATYFGSVDYAVVLSKAPGMDSGVATAIGLCLLLGAIGKSAQLPLGTWLSKAMEGPTPSSALIHAATMVTAGIYMIVRSHAIYDMAPNALLVIAIVGALTAVYAGLVGLVVTDIKGILAFSTTTQLGLMFLACGLGAYAVAIFHLVAHAFLKSFLFMTAPSILQHMHGAGDPSEKDTAGPPAPVFRLILVGTVALALVPFLAGWWTTDLTIGNGDFQNFILAAVGVMAVFATIYYAKKMMAHSFAEHGAAAEHSHAGHNHHHDDDGHGHGHSHGHESGHHTTPGSGMLGPIITLAVLAVLGLTFGLLPGGVDSTWFNQFMSPVVSVQDNQPGGNPILAYMLFGSIGLLLLASWFTALYMDRFKPELSVVLIKLRWAYALVVNRFYLDEIYDALFIRSTKRLGMLLDRFDSKVIDRIVGAPVDATRVSTALTTWEQRYLSARGANTGDESTGTQNISKEGAGVVGWLAGVNAQTTGWAGKGAVSPVSGVASKMTHIAGAGKNIENQGAGVAGWVTQNAASDTALVEKHIIGKSSGIIGSITDVFATVSAWLEHHLFGVGVNVGIPYTSNMFARILLRIEAFISKPAIAVILGILLAVLIYGVLK